MEQLKVLKNVNRDVSVIIAGNGWMITVNGNDKNDNWTTVTIVCVKIEDVVDILQFVSKLPAC